jgi:hypothetical protein
VPRLVDRNAELARLLVADPLRFPARDLDPRLHGVESRNEHDQDDDAERKCEEGDQPFHASSNDNRAFIPELDTFPRRSGFDEWRWALGVGR